MQMDVSFKIPRSAVIHEFLENEVIIADLDTGTYYSLRNVAVTVWQGVTEGLSAEKLSFMISEKFGNHAPDVCKDVKIFLSRLVLENLLEEVSEHTIAEITSASYYFPERYSPPIFEKFTEMQELLMLDPIHEVDEAGWPVRAKEVFAE